MNTPSRLNQCTLRRALALLTLVALVGLPLRPAAAAAFPTAETMAAALLAAPATPLEALLRRDGTLDLAAGFAGTIDARGWQLVSGPRQAPRFARSTLAPWTGGREAQARAPADHWDDRFALRGLDGTVFALAADGSGNLYAGGSFATAGGTPAGRIAVWDGGSWAALGTGMNGYVYALAVDGSGNLYAGGEFTTAGGTPANRIAVWDGSSWAALGSGMNAGVYALALDGSGHLYAGGYFDAAGGVSAGRIAVWDGIGWAALGSGVDHYVYALAVDGSGNLYAGGSFTTAGGISAGRVAVWDGSDWAALGSGVNNTVRALAVDGGSLYVGGEFGMAGGVQAARIAVWDGSNWAALGSGTNSAVRALTVGGGHLYAGGSFVQAGGTVVNYIAAWDGSSWASLGGGMNDSVRALLVEGGDLYAGGEFAVAGGSAALYIAAWDGSAWSALGGGSGMSQYVYALVADGSGHLYAGGRFVTAGETPANHVAVWDGAGWAALGSGLNDTVYALALDGSGHLYAGGSFGAAGGVSANRIAVWDGSSWSALGSGMNGTVRALVLDGGYLYAGGLFTTAGGVPAPYVAVWDGNAWAALGGGMNGRVLALAADGSGDLYAGGYFTTTGGVSANYVAVWHESNWAALGSGMNDDVYALALDDAGMLYAGGVFTTAGGGPANCIAVWDGSSWTPLGGGTDNTIRALALGSSGRLYAGGDFTAAGGTPAHFVAVWDGSDWTALDSGMNSAVSALAPDGSELYVGGYFSQAGGKASGYIARWFNTPPLAVDDGYQLCANNTLYVPAPGVLANDSDPEDDPLTAILVVPPVQGTAALQFDGALTYTPTLGYVGTDALDYAAVDPYGLAATATVVLTISVGTAAGFDANSPVCLGETAVFTNTTTGTGPFAYHWTFGDGGTSALQHPTHLYMVPGTYTVTLVATGTCGVDTAEAAFTVNVPTAAGFDANGPVCLGATAVFTNTTTGTGPFAYHWTFGDGGTSALQHPTHLYMVPGTYTVTLVATGTCGVDTAQGSFTVHALPIASFDYHPASGYFPLTVSFTDTSQYAASPTWAFGDGEVGSGTYMQHTYSSSGDYTVTLTVQSIYGCGLSTATASIHVVTPGLPLAGFLSSSPDCPGETTVFTNTTVGTGTLTYLWSFGDGITSTLEHPTHLYAAAGSYSVALTATNAAGSDTIRHTVLIITPPAEAGFTWEPPTPVVGQEVLFTAAAQGSPPLVYTWDLGDGTPAAGPVVAHTYAEAGDYLVTLTATNPCGQDVVSDTVAVVSDCVPPEEAAFTWYPPTPLVGQVVTYTAAAQGSPPLVYTWDLGDGTPAAGPVVAHTYMAAGDYLVSLTVTNACGQDVVSHTLVVVSSCVPPSGVDFGWSPFAPVVGDVVHFTGTLSGGTAPLVHAWAFGDGEIGAGIRVAHAYAATGTFTVVLTVTNACGEDGASHNVTVVMPPPLPYHIYLPVVVRSYTP